jgi:hypothetical protein
LPLPLSSGGIGGKGGGGDGVLWRLGELIEAPKEASRRIPPATILGEPVFEGDGRFLGECVGVPGREMLGLFEGDSPAAASVNRNSTHRRENDYRRVTCVVWIRVATWIADIYSPPFRQFSQVPKP